MITINLNTQFEVELTKRGLEIYIKYLEGYRNTSYIYKGVYNDKIAEIKKHPVLKEELWQLMYIFGEYLYNGCEIPFKNNIIEIK